MVPMSNSYDWLQIYSVGAISQSRFGLDGIKQVFADPYATRAVFVRDPLQRFLSAYLNKCKAADATEYQNCPMWKPGLVFKDAVEWALQQPDLLDVNPHWKLQAHHCELSRYIGAYNVVGVLSPSLSLDAKCLFERAGLGPYNHEFTVDEDGNGERNENLRSATSNGHTDDALLQAFFPADVARILIQHMALDYSTFHFEINPHWLSHATGMYYDIDPPVDDDYHVVLPSSTGWREY
jgi:hypothetical protein